LGEVVNSPLSSGLSEKLRSLHDPLARSARWGSLPVSQPTDEELTRISGALIAAGRNALPIKIEGVPLASTNPRRDLVHIEADEPAFVRMWLAALLHRTLDGYEATLVLRDSGLDLDARAHIRIAFEHLAVASLSCADLIDEGVLQNLSELRRSPGAEPN
jgi:hypothetical protein